MAPPRHACGARALLGAAAAAAAASLAVMPAAGAGADGKMDIPKELQDKFQRLMTWMQAGLDAWDFAAYGVDRPLPLAETFELGLGRFGRSLVAVRDVADGETITLLPKSHLVYNHVYMEGLEGLPNWQQAAVWIARQRALGQDSSYADFIAMLPGSHDDLPKHWPEGAMQDFMTGSQFPRYVKTMADDVRREWEQVTASTGISWEDYQWGHDTFQTRSVFWNGSWVYDDEPSRLRSSTFVPLFDLLMHGTENNADYKFSMETQSMRLFAKAPIRKGEEIVITYFEPPSSRSNTEVLNKWGFATDDALKMVEVKVQDLQANTAGTGGQPPRPRIPGTPEDAPEPTNDEPPTYALERTAFDQASVAFLAHLRAIADSRAFELEDNEPPLPKGWLAIPDAKTGWMYYWHKASGQATWERPGHPNGAEKPFWTPVRSWRVELAALGMARDIMQKQLAAYQWSLKDQENFLAGDIPDVKFRFMSLILRNEKQVLHWWLDLLDRAEKEAPQDLDAPVERSMVHLFDPSYNWRHEL